MAVSRVVFPLSFIITFILLGCSEWGTVADAKSIYHQHKEEYEELYRTLVAHPEINHVTPQFTPERGNMKFHDGHTNLSPMSQVVYKNLVDQMARLKILRIKHEKFDYWKTGQPVENGPTARGTDFDPDVIAAEFVKLHEGTVTDTEIVFNGAPPLRPDQGSCSTRVTFRSN